MIKLEKSQDLIFTQTSLASNERSQIKLELKQQIHAALDFANNLPPQERLPEIETRLLAIQAYCKIIAKTFIVVKQRITCDQYELGGNNYDAATLFRGPNEDASVAICVTDRGSLLHRSSSTWRVYRNAGDISV